MVPPAYPTPTDASMAAAGKQHRKVVQPNYHQTVNQQYVAEEEQMALKELLQQLHVIVEDLAALDGSLTSLFETAPNTDVTEHQQLVQFRSRVARRITRYGQLSKNMAQIVEKIISYNSAQSADDPRQREAFHPRQLHELDALLKQHQQRLQKYKSQFAAWWQNTERHFHTMRMANFVCSVQERAQTSLSLSARDGPPGGPSRSGGPRLEPVRAKATTGEALPAARGPQRPHENASLNTTTLQRPAQIQPRSQQMLQETGQAMAQEVQRMRATQEQLQQSSTALEQTEASYNGESFVSVRPPAVSELLATSAATLIAAASANSRSNTALEAEVGRITYQEAQLGAREQAKSPKKTGLKAGELMEDGLHFHMQQHEKRGSHFKQGDIQALMEDKSRHSEAQRSDVFLEETPDAAWNDAGITQLKRSPNGISPGKFNRLSVAARQQ